MVFSSYDTMPKCFLKTYQEVHAKKKIAMRVKDEGIWQPYTWYDCLQKVKFLSLGLASLGFMRGEKAVIIGENKPEWYWAELAVQSAGGVVVGVFTDCIPSEVKYYILDSEATLVIAHDQEQVDKIIEIKEEVPNLRQVIYWDEKGLWNYEEKYLYSFETVFELGIKFEKENPDSFEKSVAAGNGSDIAVLCYTSGTTGNPKGAMLSHQWLVGSGMSLAELDKWKEECKGYLSFIPPAWATEQCLGFGCLLSGIEINFPEEPETVQQNVREIGPELLFYSARLWESVSRTIQAKMADSSRLRRFIYRNGMRIALRVADTKMLNNSPGPLLKIGYWLVFQTLLRQLRDRLGLSNVAVAYSAGGALSPEIIKYFLAMQVEVKLFYGLTEAGIISIPPKGDIRPESSGVPTPWAKIKLSEEGEILVKSKYLFSGYYNKPEATEKKLRNGWFHTEDFGHITDDGHLIVIDRMQDMKPLGNKGKKFSPQYIEVRLRFSPFIKDALVIGAKDSENVGGLINIDLDNTGRFAESNGIPYTTFTDLSQRPEIIELIAQEIKTINKTVPGEFRLKKFANFHKELDADEAELTRTRKIRRDYVEGRYGDIINALFENRKTHSVETKITYRDGKEGVIKTNIHINSII